LPRKKLWLRNEIIFDESDIPVVPHFFWRSARKHYDADESVSAILMAGLAVESGVNEYASAWLHRMLGKNQTAAMKFLEESMDFRKTAELLWYVDAFKEKLKNDLNTVYNKRNKYAHMQTLKILGQMGEQEAEEKTTEGKLVRKVKFKDDEMFRMIVVIMNAEEDAWEILRKTELCMRGLFNKDESDYWKRLVWNIREEETTVQTQKPSTER
jgi:hypothetical protein